MISAVDSSILLDVLRGDARFGAASGRLLEAAAERGALCASTAVWAEVRAYYEDAATHSAAMEALFIGFSPLIEAAAAQAGALWRQYRAAGGPRTRIATDFLIGAHASCQADCLLTRDRGFYRAYFDSLRLVTPAID